MSLDWDKLREGQREAAVETVKCALVLDELSRREQIAVSAEDVDAEIARLAEQHGQSLDERPQAAREGPRHRPDLHGSAPGEDD